MSFAYASQTLGTWNPSIAARQYWDVELPVSSTDGFFVFDILVEQLPNRVDDIVVLVFDEENHDLWLNNKTAVRAGANVSLLPKPNRFINTKVVKANLSFRPESKGKYFLALDNIHSSFTQKNVTLKVYWVWTASPLKNFIKRRLKELTWDEVWEHLKNADKAFEANRLLDCCNNLRTGLITLWLNVCSSLDKNKVSIPPGKTPDVSLLTNILKQHGTPDYIAGMINRIWSLDSELIHAEKRGGQTPPTEEVIYARSLTFATVGYLLSLNLN
jgi:hypothetical protein